MKINTFICFLLVHIVLLCGVTSFSSAAPPVQSNLEKVELEAEQGGYELIDLETLWTLYQTEQEKVLLVDTRQEWEYRSGYIRGAVNFPMEPTWPATMTQRGALEQFLGTDRLQTIVFY
jgi:3-mercaptopyruvate sulfurtransferase SseA